MVKRVAYGLTADLSGLVSSDPAEVGEQLRGLGCDGVFLKSPSAEWVHALRGAGLRVYASIGIFSAGDDLWDRIPGSRPITAQGTPAPVEQWYRPALPVSSVLRAHRLAQLESLLTTVPLDGIWLDFIRWPARWEKPQPELYHCSFDPVTLRRFQSDTGINLPPGATEPSQAAAWLLGNAAEVWFGWRCHQITSFVAEARQVIQRHQPECLLGVFTVPWTGLAAGWSGMASDLLRDPPVWFVGQDPGQLGRQVDIISPMVYHRLCGRDAGWIAEVVAWTASQTECALWPIIEAIEPPPVYDAHEFTDACRAATIYANDGLIVFKLDGLLADEKKTAAWQEML